MRSVNTTLVTLLPVLSMLIVGQFVFGQKTLGDFSFALLIGLVFGTYSSLFVASPLTTVLEGARAPLHRDPQAPDRQGRRRERHLLARRGGLVAHRRDRF